MRFRPSKLFRDAVASCLWSAPVFGILWYVRFEYGRDAMYDVFAAITAWGILAALIFAFRGEGSTSEKKPVEGTTDPLLARNEILSGFDWFGCVCGWRYMPPSTNGSVDCPRCGNHFEWTDFGRTSIIGTRVEVTTRWGGATAVRTEPDREVEIQVQSEEGGGDE